jgi:hypothetical protein
MGMSKSGERGTREDLLHIPNESQPLEMDGGESFSRELVKRHSGQAPLGLKHMGVCFPNCCPLPKLISQNNGETCWCRTVIPYIGETKVCLSIVYLLQLRMLL